MKVIKEGKWNLVWTTEITCPTCEAVLLVEEADVKTKLNVTAYECACVVCKKTVAIPTSQISLRVREAAEKKRTHSPSYGYRD